MERDRHKVAPSIQEDPILDAYTQIIVAATENTAITEEDQKVAQALNELLTCVQSYRHDSEPPSGRGWEDLHDLAHTGRRGRPRKYVYDSYLARQSEYEPSTRALQNRVNAETLWLLLFDLFDAKAIPVGLLYFYDQRGDGLTLRHQGIGEQIGRMLNEGLINEFHAVQLAKRSAYLCSWCRSKEVERMLRQLHKHLKNKAKTVAATENKK